VLVSYLITLALFMHGIGHLLFLMNSWGLSSTGAGRSWLFSGALGAGQTVEGLVGLLWLWRPWSASSPSLGGTSPKGDGGRSWR
jgi:hypothetical protein